MIESVGVGVCSAAAQPGCLLTYDKSRSWIAIYSLGGNEVMPAFDSAQASASTETVSDRALLDALVVVAARRLVLGVDVAAAKFLSGQRVDDLVREQEILESMASTLTSMFRVPGVAA